MMDMSDEEGTWAIQTGRATVNEIAGVELAPERWTIEDLEWNPSEIEDTAEE
jgi:hypothetical protein